MTHSIALLNRQLRHFEIERDHIVGAGRAIHYLGIIVTPELMDYLQKTHVVTTDGTYTVIDQIGNCLLSYTFYVVSDTTIPKIFQGSLFTHLTKDQYRNQLMGRIEHVYIKPKQKVQIGGYIVTLNNFVTGHCSIQDGTGSSEFYNIYLDELLPSVQKHVKSMGIEPINIDTDGLVRQIPVTRWMGNFVFSDTGSLYNSWFSGSYPFLFDDSSLHNQCGRLVMRKNKKGLFDMVGICQDGYGHMHITPTDMPPTNDKMVFAAEAIKYFHPEEIFLRLGLRKRAAFDAIKALETSRKWISYCKPEELGKLRTDTTTSKEPQNHTLFTKVVTTRGSMIELVVKTYPEMNETLWLQQRSEYFPKDWTDWPENPLTHVSPDIYG